jgi:hypothetical protein
MKRKKSAGFIILDVFYIVMAILPLVFGIVLDILTTPAAG